MRQLKKDLDFAGAMSTTGYAYPGELIPVATSAPWRSCSARWRSKTDPKESVWGIATTLNGRRGIVVAESVEASRITAFLGR